MIVSSRRLGWFSRIFAESAWLTKKRTLQIAILFASLNLVMTVVFMRSYLLDDAALLPDFAAFWAAAVATLNGEPALAYNPIAHREIQIEALGQDYTSFLAWHYPPTFQLIVTPFGVLPLFVSFAVWNILSVALYLCVCYRILPSWITLIAAWGVATSLIVVAIGQTGFLTAATLGLFLIELRKRPFLAGVFLGLLTVKPHLGIAAPFALVAGGKWRTIIGAALCAVLLVAAAHLAFGSEIWTAFNKSLRLSTAIFQDQEGAWTLYATLYGGARMIGAPLWLAASVQSVAAAAVLFLLVRLWRRPEVSDDLKAAVLCYALAIMTPRLLHYDLHILFVGALFQVRHGLANGFARWEKSLLLLAAVMPVAFFFQSLSGLLRINPYIAPVLLLSCLLDRPELRRVIWPLSPTARGNARKGGAAGQD